MSASGTAIDNPLRAGLGLEGRPPPCILVIFGASGDLTRRKLLPALYALWSEQRLPPGFTALGVARRPLSDEAFRHQMREAVAAHGRLGPPDTAACDTFAGRLFYHRLDFAETEGYPALAARLAALDRLRGTGGNYLFYLATPPSAYSRVVPALAAAGLGGRTDAGEPARARAGDEAVGDRGWRRLVVEKPVGHDWGSARALNRVLARAFAEAAIFRIDHYLGKETVQNLLVFRFANEIFETVFTRAQLDHVQITVAEAIGIEGRAAHYEETGALRDMVQNHLLQLLCLVAMEPPVSLGPDAVRDEKTRVLRAVRSIHPEEVARVTVRGQYGPGAVLGTPVPGYREEPGVRPDSPTETYAALRLELPTWRWAGVPFYLRSGKRLAKRVTEIAVQFRSPPQPLFGDEARGLPANLLVFRIQPDEGIALRFGAKLPGPEPGLRPVTMDFRYGTSFGIAPPEAYERLLLDAMRGDPTLFARDDWVEAAWALLTPVLEGWGESPPAAFPNYAAGTWGPVAADELLARDGRRWRRP